MCTEFIEYVTFENYSHNWCSMRIKRNITDLVRITKITDLHQTLIHGLNDNMHNILSFSFFISPDSDG